MKIIRIFSKNFFRKKVVKDFIAISGSNILLRPIQLVKGIVVAKYLGPADYGLLKSIELIQMLNKYGSLGFNTALTREAGNAIGNKDNEKLNLVRNTVFSSEIILTLVLFFIGVLITFFVNSKEVAALIILASFGLLLSKLRGILATEATINKNFILISKITLFSVGTASIIVIITVPFLKIYAILLTNILIGIFAIILFIKALSFRMNFRIDWNEFKRILKISLPLVLNTLSIALYKYAERILLLVYLGDVELGIYSFSLLMVDQISIIFKSSIKVRRQDIFEALGNKSFDHVHKMVMNETFLLTLVSIFFLPLAYFLIQNIIPIFLYEWLKSIQIGQLLLLSLPFYVIYHYPEAVLLSALVNKQSVLSLYRYVSAALLVFGSVLLSYYDMMNLRSFAVLHIVCQAYYNILVLIFYKIYFINLYTSSNK